MDVAEVLRLRISRKLASVNLLQVIGSSARGTLTDDDD